MKSDVQKQASEYRKAHQKKKRRYSMLLCLASVVVLCTTYALILPAVTMGHEHCDIPEHTHTEDCYEQVTTTTVEKRLICTESEEDGHVHTDECYETVEIPVTEEVLVCGMEEHKHTEDCTACEEDTDEEQDVQSIAEAAEGNNWIRLRDSGWFDEYSDYDSEKSTSRANLKKMGKQSAEQSAPSDIQVKDRGGTNYSADGAVSVSKTISGTDLENVFDITLQVQTSENLLEITEAPDIAVVIVMDISNTMNSDFGGVTRYAAAMTSAESFLDQFTANNSLGISKVGYVAFNTDAHKIFGLQTCSTQAQADALKKIMRTETGKIINEDGYASSHSRFTNVEAGLAMASDMLSGSSNKNKYIIFLSDGFPTTYISSGYSGYDPYDSTGKFYDHVLKKPCLYGTSYSDEAAIRARNKAAAIKATGTKIFSIGVDVAGQTIQKYITQSENANGFSVVDRTGTTYEIGDASSTEAYKNWLRNSIGSGYYYDSTDSAGLKAAYDQIFQEIKHQTEVGSEADWVASDPLPMTGSPPEKVEFIGLFNKNSELKGNYLTGTNSQNGENTAEYEKGKNTINWDLKKSGYTVEKNGDETTYTYSLVYRVRLENEKEGFTEGTIYPTNDTTTLRYRTIKKDGEQVSVSEPKTVEFPIPSVHGFLGELTFEKVDGCGRKLEGAEFTLSHDKVNCSICRGDKTAVNISDMKAVSNENGYVTFTNIPSGHKYLLTETVVPEGYSKNDNTYQVQVAYDEVTVTVTDYQENPLEWNGKIENHEYYALPETGGPGTYMYIIGGLLLIAAAGALMIYNQAKHRKEKEK